jgi:hypothetical protein
MHQPRHVPPSPELGRPAIWLAPCPSRRLTEQRQCVHELLQWVFAQAPFRAADRPSLMHDPSGRPTLSEPYAALPVSIAHTHGAVVVAIGTLGQQIGVDVEAGHRQVNAARIAARTFTASESACFQADADTFWPIWTRKEALLKSLGLGLGDTDWSRYDTGDPGVVQSIATLPHTPAPETSAIEARLGHLWIDNLCVGWACRPRTT